MSPDIRAFNVHVFTNDYKFGIRVNISIRHSNSKILLTASLYIDHSFWCQLKVYYISIHSKKKPSTKNCLQHWYGNKSQKCVTYTQPILLSSNGSPVYNSTNGNFKLTCRLPLCDRFLPFAVPSGTAALGSSPSSLPSWIVLSAIWRCGQSGRVIDLLASLLARSVPSKGFCQQCHIKAAR